MAGELNSVCRLSLGVSIVHIGLGFHRHCRSRDQAGVAAHVALGLRAISKEAAHDRTIAHLGDMGIAVIERAVKQDARRAPGTALVAGPDAADASALGAVLPGQRHMAIARVKNTEQVAILLPANVRERLVGSGSIPSGDDRDAGGGALSAVIMNRTAISFMRFIELAPDNPTSSARSKPKN